MLLPPNGVVFMTRAIDADFIKDVEHDTLLRFTVLPVEAFNSLPVAADDVNAFKIVREDGSINSYSVVRDVFDCAAFCLRLVTGREIAQLGKRLFLQNFILIVVTGMGMLIAFLVFTEKQILRRILSMQRQAQHIEKSSEPLKKIDIQGDDEIFDLSLNLFLAFKTFHSLSFLSIKSNNKTSLSDIYCPTERLHNALVPVSFIT